MTTATASLSFATLADFDRGHWHQLQNSEFFAAIDCKGRIKKSGDSTSATAAALRTRLTKQFPTVHLMDSVDKSTALWSVGLESNDRTVALFELAKPNGDQSIDPQSNGNGQARVAGEPDASASLNAVLDDIAEVTAASPVELIVLAELLREHDSWLNDADLVRLWRMLLVESLAFCSELPEPEGEAIAEHQRAMVMIEIPFQAALLFADVKGAAGIRKQAATTANLHLESLTDTDGTPHGRLLHGFRFWLASLTRCVLWADWSATKFWNRESQERFKSVIAAAMAMTDRQGRLPFDTDIHCYGRAVLSVACAGGWKRKSPVTRLIECWNGDAPIDPNAKRPHPKKVDPSPTGQSDWAELAYLRSHWSTDGDRIVVGHGDSMPILDFACRGVPVLSGDWELEISINGAPISSVGEWYNVCWFSDSDSDYVELQWTVKDVVRVERQIFLSRTNQYGILADCLTADISDAVEMRSRIPLATGIEHRTLSRSRELMLESSGIHVRAFPVALDHDRVQKAVGELQVLDNQLQWSQRGEGAIFAPVFFDWSPERRDAEAVWNRLTVTDDRRVVSAAEAVGFRLRVGKSQSVMYRNHRRDGSHRAVLGCHTTNETIIGRFNAKSGEVEPLVFVE
ncbi:MAG: hypothetical protein O3A00_22645 [Planctomycetota bacterium]|nr:hypothetical protein [Planctomycetota bacterium]